MCIGHVFSQNFRLFSDFWLVTIVKCQRIDAKGGEIAVLNKPLNLFSNIQNKGITVHGTLTELQNSIY